MNSFKNILALDTALGGCCAALVAGERSSVRGEAMPRGQAEYLVPFSQQVMGECELSYDALDAVLCTVGPGAFTGLRIGISTARAFGLSLGIPVFGVTTLQAISMKASQEGVGAHTVILETKRQDFYAQNFGKDGRAIDDAVALHVEELEERVQSLNCLVGDGARRFVEMSGRSDWACLEGYDLPDMLLVSRMLQDKGAECGVFLSEADPVYLRGADVSQPKVKPRQIEQV